MNEAWPMLTLPSSCFTLGSSECSAASRGSGEKPRGELGGGIDGRAASQIFAEVIDAAGIY